MVLLDTNNLHNLVLGLDNIDDMKAMLDNISRLKLLAKDLELDLNLSFQEDILRSRIAERELVPNHTYVCEVFIDVNNGGVVYNITKNIKSSINNASLKKKTYANGAVVTLTPSGKDRVKQDKNFLLGYVFFNDYTSFERYNWHIMLMHNLELEMRVDKNLSVPQKSYNPLSFITKDLMAGVKYCP